MLCKDRIGTDRRIDRQAIRTCGISDCKNMLCVHEIVCAMFLYPCKYQIGIFKRRRELKFRCQTVSKIHDRKATSCQIHAIILIAFFISIYPATAVYTDDDGKFLPFRHCFLRAVYIQLLPCFIRSV